MKKFVIQLLLFSAIFLVYDKVFIIVSNLSARAEVDKRLEFVLNGKINRDIIIIGSSTGSRGIIARRIEDQTGFTTYNLCYPGSNAEFHEFILRTLTEFNEKPKLLLFVVDDCKELLFDETTAFRNDRLYPLVRYPYVMQELINRGDKDWLMSSFLVLHRLNKSNFDLRKKEFTPLDTIMECGSMPISWQREGRAWHYLTEDMPYDPDLELAEKVQAYKKIINLCNSKNIKLVVVSPPVYKIPSKSFMDRIIQLSGYDADFYEYNTENPIYKDKKYYYDETHLMVDAAKIFTDELIMYLKTNIISNLDSDNNQRTNLTY